MLNPKLKPNPPRKNKRNRCNKPIYKYRSLLVAALFSSSSFLPMFPVLAASPTPGTVIDNQATGSFTDPSDGSEKQIESNVVQVEVAEVAGITISQAALPEEAPSGVNGAGANQENGEINPDDIIYFTYKITNVGNDPTQFFIPDAPSSVNNGSLNGNIQIIEYDPDGASAVDLTSNNITVPSNGDTTGSLLNGVTNTNDGSVPAGGSITIRVPVKASSTTLTDGDKVTVVMGDTTATNAQNEAYAAGNKDVYTQDNSGTANGDTDGSPIEEREASLSQDVDVVVTSVATAPVAMCPINKGLQFVPLAQEDTSIGLLGWPTGTGTSTRTYTNVNGTGIDIKLTTYNTDGVTPTTDVSFIQFAGSLRRGGLFRSGANWQMSLEFFETGTTTPAPVSGIKHTLEDFEGDASRAEQVGNFEITPFGGSSTALSSATDVTVAEAYSGTPQIVGNLFQGYYTPVGGPQANKWTILEAAAGQSYTRIDVDLFFGTGLNPIINLCQPAGADTGDAPVSYGDARHQVTASSSVYLGNTAIPDIEFDAPNSANGGTDGTGDDSDGIDDEDGITLPSSITAGSTISLPVTVTGSGALNAWIDWNQDGDFTDANEQIATDADVSGGTLSVNVPAGATAGTTYARFRYSTQTGLTPTGGASDGEVEDYQVEIAAATPIDKIPDPPPTSTDPTPPEGRICAAPGSDGSISLSGVVNTYHPGAASVSAGNSSITLGAINPNGNTTLISKGDKLLIIQMQDAEINSTNTDAYGNGSAGGAASGSTALNTAGYYQYVVADNDVPTSGGTLQIKESLEYTFTNADATATSGQRRFQVVRLPQHTNATISSTVTAAPWNGNSGGIFALDVSNTLTFSGGTIDVNGQGFRGGGGIDVSGNNTPLPAPGNTDYVNLSTQPFHGSKGEGIAGTPRLIRNDVTTTVTDNSIEGYPNGSFGRGAPGNAGGGSTDPNQQKNAANTGGGGGANHGYGGHGGDSWTDGYGRQPTGGYGGQAFPTSFNRIIMGGGGGAGTANNSPSGPTPSGGAGGGIVILRAGEITGTGSIETNGIQGVEPEGTDGGGGGGAGGSVMVLSVDPSSASLTINARGGNGLNSGFREHGPGGGGGGGYIAYQGLTPIADVSGGQPGNDKAGGTVNPDPDPYGATAGAEGFAEPATIPDAGVKPGAECHPNLLLVKRITKINDNNFTDYIDEPGNAYDDNTQTVAEPENTDDPPQDTDNKWPTPLTDSLRGVINGGKVEPDDEVEYTIYFLSAGDIQAKSVLFCDRVPGNVSFIPNSFNNVTQATGGLATADRGIMWLKDGVEQSLTNDKDGDAAQYFPPGVEPSTVYPKIQCEGANTNGAVVVNLSNLPKATAPGTPNTSYGYVRFRGKVK